jgi:hypothetical protein
VRFVSAAVTMLVLGAGVTAVLAAPGLVSPASAAGSPGVPQPGTPVYFENSEDVTGNAALGILNYKGAAAAGDPGGDRA